MSIEISKSSDASRFHFLTNIFQRLCLKSCLGLHFVAPLFLLLPPSPPPPLFLPLLAIRNCCILTKNSDTQQKTMFNRYCCAVVACNCMCSVAITQAPRPLGTSCWGGGFYIVCNSQVIKWHAPLSHCLSRNSLKILTKI